MKRVLKKAQASIEYLTTYGWLMLIIIASVGVIAYFGLLSPTRYMPQDCNTGGQLECMDFVLDEQGVFKMSLHNNMGKEIKITGLEGNTMEVYNCIVPVNLPSGERRNITCNLTTDVARSQIVNLDFTIYYSRNQPSAPVYTIPGHITAKAVPQLPEPLVPPKKCVELGYQNCTTDQYCAGTEMYIEYWNEMCCQGTCMKITQCMDGVDNDNDGCVDMWDWGCRDSSDNSENTVDSRTMGGCRPGCDTYPQHRCIPDGGACTTLPTDPRTVYPCEEGYFCCFNEDWP